MFWNQIYYEAISQSDSSYESGIRDNGQRHTRRTVTHLEPHSISQVCPSDCREGSLEIARSDDCKDVAQHRRVAVGQAQRESAVQCCRSRDCQCSIQTATRGTSDRDRQRPRRLLGVCIADAEHGTTSDTQRARSEDRQSGIDPHADHAGQVHEAIDRNSIQDPRSCRPHETNTGRRCQHAAEHKAAEQVPGTGTEIECQGLVVTVNRARQVHGPSNNLQAHQIGGGEDTTERDDGVADRDLAVRVRPASIDQDVAIAERDRRVVCEGAVGNRANCADVQVASDDEY